MAVTLEAKKRENAALQERAEMFAVETQKIEGLRAMRLARDAAVKAKGQQESGKTPAARKDLAA